MSGKALVWLAGIAGCLMVFLSGCETTPAKKAADAPLEPKPAAEFVLKFAVNDSTTYRVETHTGKDYRFEQPSLGKLDEKQSGATTEVEFVQRIESIDEYGVATANITLKAISYLVSEKSSVRFDFDSRRESDKNQPFSKLIGQSYKISISPNGDVKVLDVKRARNTVTTGSIAKLVSSFLGDRAIVKRHSISALPQGETAAVEPGGTWSRIKPPPPGLLTPKSFEKIYKLKKIEARGPSRFAFVEMTGLESDEPVGNANQSTSGLGGFANMFDTQEKLAGQLVFDLDTGRVSLYEEKLVVTHLAAENADNQKDDKGPDTLLMRFTDAVTIEMIEPSDDN